MKAKLLSSVSTEFRKIQQIRDPMASGSNSCWRAPVCYSPAFTPYRLTSSNSFGHLEMSLCPFLNVFTNFLVYPSICYQEQDVGEPAKVSDPGLNVIQQDIESVRLQGHCFVLSLISHLPH